MLKGSVVARRAISLVCGPRHRNAAKAKDPRLVLTGLRGSLASGDVPTLQAIHQNYAELSEEPWWLTMLQEIKISYVNTSAQAVDALGQTATDAKVGLVLRVAAAGALARMHTRQSLPYLGHLLDGNQNPGDR